MRRVRELPFLHGLPKCSECCVSFSAQLIANAEHITKRLCMTRWILNVPAQVFHEQECDVTGGA